MTVADSAVQKLGDAPSKKPYEPPAFRFERVFEVSALTCGKVSGTQESCRTNRKVS